MRNAPAVAVPLFPDSQADRGKLLRHVHNNDSFQSRKLLGKFVCQKAILSKSHLGRKPEVELTEVVGSLRVQ